MKSTFLDSSAFFKIYAGEHGSERVISLMSNAADVIVSELVLPELASALAKAIRQKKLPSEAWAQVQSSMETDLLTMKKIPVSTEILRAAVRCIGKTELRGADAIHVASALQEECGIFVTADRQQCEAAKKLGLKVELIS